MFLHLGGYFHPQPKSRLQRAPRFVCVLDKSNLGLLSQVSHLKVQKSAFHIETGQVSRATCCMLAEIGGWGGQTVTRQGQIQCGFERKLLLCVLHSGLTAERILCLSRFSFVQVVQLFARSMHPRCCILFRQGFLLPPCWNLQK